MPSGDRARGGSAYGLGQLLLFQESQLLLPLLTDPRDERVEKAELLTFLIHLEVGVLKHDFKSVIGEDVREALWRKGPAEVGT